MPRLVIPRSAIAALAFVYIFFLAGWLFLSRAFDQPNWFFFLLSLVVAAVFVSFYVSGVGLLWFIGTERPAWLSQKQAVWLAASGFVVQALLTGALSLVGAWPHKDLWFLGAIPFLWRG